MTHRIGGRRGAPSAWGRRAAEVKVTVLMCGGRPVEMDLGGTGPPYLGLSGAAPPRCGRGADPETRRSFPAPHCRTQNNARRHLGNRRTLSKERVAAFPPERGGPPLRSTLRLAHLGVSGPKGARVSRPGAPHRLRPRGLRPGGSDGVQHEGRGGSVPRASLNWGILGSSVARRMATIPGVGCDLACASQG